MKNSAVFVSTVCVCVHRWSREKSSDSPNLVIGWELTGSQLINAKSHILQGHTTSRDFRLAPRLETNQENVAYIDERHTLGWTGRVG